MSILGKTTSQLHQRWFSLRRFYLGFHRTREMSTFQDLDLSEIRAQFHEIGGGGAVTLRKDETISIGFIALEHPEKKNALTCKMMVQLNEIITDLQDWTSGKGLIIYGKGDSFCSGLDLDSVVKPLSSPQHGYMISKLLQDTLLRLRGLPLVSLTIVHGNAIGGGAELILGSDFRLMTSGSSSSVIQYVHGRMGIGTVGASTLMSQSLGPSRTLQILLRGSRIHPEEALRIGLIDEIIPESNSSSEEKRVEFGVKWLSGLLGHHPSTIVQTLKTGVQSQSLEVERKLFASCWGGPLQKAALAAKIKHNKIES